MPTVTIEQIQTRQSEIEKLIQQFRAQTAQSPSCIEIEEYTIDLEPGEHYAGAVLDADGQHMHHLVLMDSRPVGDLTWQQAMDWASSVKGTLPTRQEQSLLFANCKRHVSQAWHWSSEVYETDASYAWGCNFGNGHQLTGHKSYEGSAVAVRRI